MKHLAWIAGLTLLAASSVSAQTMQTTISGTEEGVSVVPPQPAEDRKESKVYNKVVGGLVWLEGTIGPSQFNVTKFRSLNLVPAEIAAQVPSVVVSGPEFGASLKIRAGSVVVGGNFQWADYEPFDLITAGLGFEFLIRAVPYVQPTIKFGLNYNTTRGGLAIPQIPGGPSLADLTNVRTDGGGASIGLGLRIPIVKWVSLAAEFDYSVIGLAVRGDLAGDSFTGGTAGTAIAGTFALTIHLGT
ncbi:MAG: hypothetical protein AAGF92_02555 [Myxococcota bacterium]